MAYDIGPRIGIEGEKEFKQALSDINKNLSVLGSEMGKVAAQFSTNANSMEALKAKSEVYNKQIDEQKKKIETLKAALENSAKEFGENDNRTKNWQISLNKAEAELAKLNTKAEENAKYLEEASKSADGHAKSIDEAGKKAKQSGNDAEKGESGWSKFGSGLSKAGEMAGKAVAALGAAAAAAGTALVGASVSGASFADEILTLSTQTGLATDQLQEFKYMQELIDVPLETMTKSLAKNVKSMSDAANGSKNAVEAYKKLGIEFQNADGSLRDANDVYFEAIDALGKMNNETERDAIAMQLFGRSARELAPMIEAGSEELNRLRQEAHEMGYVLSDETLDAFGEFDDGLQRLKAGAEGAKNAFGRVLLPVLGTLAGEGADLLGEFTKGMNEVGGDVSKMADVVSTMLTSVVGKITEFLPQLMESGMQIISSIGQAMLDNLPLIIESAVMIITTLLSGIIESLPQLIDGGLQIVTALTKAITDNLPMIIEGALELILALAKGIVEALPELIPAVIDTVIMIVETLIDNIDMLIDAAIAIILALAEGLIDALPKLIEKIPVIIDKLIDAIMRNLPLIIDAGIKITVAVAEGLIKAIPQLISKIPEIIASIVKGFNAGISNIVNIGKNIVEGIWEGIKAMGQWIKDKVTGFFSGIVDGVKGVLGIKSPSKVFAGIGENMALGLGQGFEDEMDSINKKIKNSIPTSFDLNGNYNIGTGNAGFATKQPIINVTPLVMLDGKVITKRTSRIQSQFNNSKFRALGVMA